MLNRKHINPKWPFNDVLSIQLKVEKSRNMYNSFFTRQW